MRQFWFSLILLLADQAWGQNIGPGGGAATPGGSTTNPAYVNEVGNSYPAGLVPVSDVATSLFQDSFPAGALGTGKWIATNGGGGVAQSGSAGLVTIGSGTLANGYSSITTVPSFTPVPPGWNEFEQGIKIPSSLDPNVAAFWGYGTSPGSPTAAIPITEGCGFELQVGGKMYVSCFAASVRTVIQDLSAATGSGKQPIDGGAHTYTEFQRDDYFWFAIDGAVVATQTTSVNGPNVITQPLKIQVVAGTSNPVASLTVTVVGTWVADLGRNGLQLSDGTVPTQKAQVSPGGAVATGAPTTSYQGTMVLTAATSLAMTSGNVTMSNSTVLPAAGSFVKLTVINVGANPAYACWLGGTASTSAGCELLAAGASDTVNLYGNANAPTFFSTAGSTLSFRN